MQTEGISVWKTEGGVLASGWWYQHATVEQSHCGGNTLTERCTNIILSNGYVRRNQFAFSPNLSHKQKEKKSDKLFIMNYLHRPKGTH